MWVFCGMHTGPSMELVVPLKPQRNARQLNSAVLHAWILFPRPQNHDELTPCGHQPTSSPVVGFNAPAAFNRWMLSTEQSDLV